MFYLLAILAPAGYALQNTLMSAFYRRMDRLSAITYRGLSLAVSMAPVLLFVPFTDIVGITKFLPELLAASLLAAIGNWAAASAYYYLPVGIGNALCMSFASIVATIIGYFSLAETLSPLQLCFVVLLLTEVMLLGRFRNPINSLASYNFIRGITASAIFGFCLGIAYIIVAIISRELNPLVAGYFWEATIGVIGATIAISRGVIGRSGLHAVDLITFKRILVYSSATIVGTGCFATAVTLGPLSIATALLALAMVFSSVFAYLVYHEALNRRQIMLIIVICLTVAGLRLLGSASNAESLPITSLEMGTRSE